MALMVKEQEHSESALITRLRSGDETAFKVLFDRYATRVYNVSYSYLNNRQASQEIVQEVFLKIWQYRDRLVPELPIVPYLVKIAKNILINQVKRQVLEKAYIQSLEFGPAHNNRQTENNLYFAEVQKLVDDQVNDFPEKRKDIFVLSRVKGLTNLEIADKMKISERTVENQINKALKTLRQKLKGQGYLNLLL